MTRLKTKKSGWGGSKGDTGLLSLPLAFPIKGRKGHWSLVHLAALSSNGEVPYSDPPRLLGPITLEYNPHIWSPTQCGKQEANTLLGTYTVQ